MNGPSGPTGPTGPVAPGPGRPGPTNSLRDVAGVRVGLTVAHAAPTPLTRAATGAIRGLGATELVPAWSNDIPRAGARRPAPRSAPDAQVVFFAACIGSIFASEDGPSGGSAATYGLLRLAALTGEARYEQAAAGAIALLHAIAPQHPTAFGHLLQAIDFHLASVKEVALAGPDTGALERAVRAEFRPHLVLAGGGGEDHGPGRRRAGDRGQPRDVAVHEGRPIKQWAHHQPSRFMAPPTTTHVSPAGVTRT